MSRIEALINDALERAGGDKDRAMAILASTAIHWHQNASPGYVRAKQRNYQWTPKEQVKPVCPDDWVKTGRASTND